MLLNHQFRIYCNCKNDRVSDTQRSLQHVFITLILMHCLLLDDQTSVRSCNSPASRCRLHTAIQYSLITYLKAASFSVDKCHIIIFFIITFTIHQSFTLPLPLQTQNSPVLQTFPTVDCWQTTDPLDEHQRLHFSDFLCSSVAVLAQWHFVTKNNSFDVVSQTELAAYQLLSMC